MNLDTLFVRDQNEFDECKRMVQDVFYLERRLPEQVFREQFHYYLFEEFDWELKRIQKKMMERLRSWNGS
jgi:hypothetical protein